MWWPAHHFSGTPSCTGHTMATARTRAVLAHLRTRFPAKTSLEAEATARMDAVVVVVYHHITLNLALICCIVLGTSRSLPNQLCGDVICSVLTPGLFLVGCAHFLPSVLGQLGDATSRTLYCVTGLCQAVLAAGLPLRRTRAPAARLAAVLSLCIWPSTFHLLKAGLAGGLRVFNQLCLVRLLLLLSRGSQEAGHLSACSSAAVALITTGFIAALPAAVGPAEEVVLVVVKGE